MKSIAIIGATGMLGQPVTRALIQAGFTVRLVARHVDKTKQLFPTASVVAGDLSDLQSLKSALTGVDFVYLNLSITQTEPPSAFHTEVQGMANLLEAARQVGIKRIGYLSSLVMRYQGTAGFRWWVFEVKQTAVDLLKSSGIPYSIFYPSCFMETLLASQRQGNRILLIGNSPVRPYFIAASDYGQQVAQAFNRAEDSENQDYVIQGPVACTQQEAAQMVAKSYTKESLSVITLPPFLLKAGSLFSAQADYGWHITEAINKYPEVFEASQTWADLGRPTTTLRQFAEQMSNRI